MATLPLLCSRVLLLLMSCRRRYIDDSDPDHSFPVYSEADIEFLVQEVASQRAGARAWFSDLDRFKFGWAAMRHVAAMSAGLHALSIAVVGSQRPRFEAILLALGARHVTVIEYALATDPYMPVTCHVMTPYQIQPFVLAPPLALNFHQR